MNVILLSMARARNSVATVTLTLSTTLQVRNWLEVLVADGTYGKNVAEAAERLLADKIREVRSSMAVPARRREIVQEIFRLEAPLQEDWSALEEEIARAHADRLP
jgi:hypothetical protein